MRFINFSKRRLAGFILLSGVCCGGIILFKLIEAKNYSNLEKNLANQLIASSELVRLRSLKDSNDWNQLLGTNLVAEENNGEKLDYLLLSNDTVAAASLSSKSIEKIKNLNLQKIAFLDQAFVRDDLMLRSSVISNKESGNFTYLVLSYDLNNLYRRLLFYKIGLLLAVIAAFFGIKSIVDAFWRKKIVPLYHLKDRAKDVIIASGFFGEDQIERSEIDSYPNYLSKSFDHLLHREQVVKEQLHNLEMEWEEFFRGLPLAAIKLYGHEGKIASVWGASDQLNQILAPGMVDSQNPITSIFASSIEFASSTDQIEKQVLSCYEKSGDEISLIINQLPRNARIVLGEEEKKIFFAWTPCMDDGTFVAMVLEVRDVGLYGQGQEIKQLKQIEYQVALDVIRSGSSSFTSALDKIKNLSNEIIEITEKERPTPQMQFEIKALILEFRAILVEAKLDTLSTQLTKLILEILPADAFNSIPDGPEKHDWAQLSPIVVYIVNLASSVAESSAIDIAKTRKFSFNRANLDSLVSRSVDVGIESDI